MKKIIINTKPKIHFSILLILVFLIGNSPDLLAQDPLVIYPNGKIGMGTTNPQGHLHIKDEVLDDTRTTVKIQGRDGNTTNDSEAVLKIDGYRGSSSAQPAKIEFNIRGNNAAAIGMMSGSSNSSTSGGKLVFSTSENATGLTERMRISRFGDVGIGGLPADNYKLKVYGPLSVTDATLNGKVGIGGNHDATYQLKVYGPLSATSATFNGDVNVGGTGNAKLKTRHIEGKASNSTAVDNLYLNYNTGKNVEIGYTGNHSNLNVRGNVTVDNDLNVKGKMGTQSTTSATGYQKLGNVMIQ